MSVVLLRSASRIAALSFTVVVACDSEQSAPEGASPSARVVGDATEEALLALDPTPRAIPILFQPDAPYGYAVALESKLDLPGNAKSVEFRLEARLALVDRAVDNGVRRALRLVTPEVIGFGDSANADFTALQIELAGPFAVTLEAGRVEALHHPKGLSAFAVNIQRTVAAALQFGTPEAKVAASWTVDEFDATGRYVAEYAFLPRSDASTEIVRRKLRYRATVGGEAAVGRRTRTASGGSSGTSLRAQPGSVASTCDVSCCTWSSTSG